MKTLITLGAVIALITSCTKPSAEVSISNPNPKLNEKFHVENQSRGGDVRYIKMNGAGIMDETIKIAKDDIITDSRFFFKYTEPGAYKIEVIVESKSLFGGMENSSNARHIVVIDPDAKPAGPVPPVDGIKTDKGNPRHE